MISTRAGGVGLNLVAADTVGYLLKFSEITIWRVNSFKLREKKKDIVQNKREKEA